MEVPEEGAVSDGAVCKNIEGNLLYVVIAVVEEDAAAVQNKRKYCCQIQQYSDEKEPDILPGRAVTVKKRLRRCFL